MQMGHYSNGKIPPGISLHVATFSQVNNSPGQHGQIIRAQYTLLWFDLRSVLPFLT